MKCKTCGGDCGIVHRFRQEPVTPTVTRTVTKPVTRGPAVTPTVTGPCMGCLTKQSENERLRAENAELRRRLKPSMSPAERQKAYRERHKPQGA